MCKEGRRYRTHKEVLEEALKDPEVRAEYERLEPEFKAKREELLKRRRAEQVEEYVNKRYPIILEQNEQNGKVYWFATVPDLPGCYADGKTPDEAIAELQDAKRLWIQTHIEDGWKVSEPTENLSLEVEKYLKEKDSESSN